MKQPPRKQPEHSKNISFLSKVPTHSFKKYIERKFCLIVIYMLKNEIVTDKNH